MVADLLIEKFNAHQLFDISLVWSKVGQHGYPISPTENSDCFIYMETLKNKLLESSRNSSRVFRVESVEIQDPFCENIGYGFIYLYHIVINNKMNLVKVMLLIK